MPVSNQETIFHHVGNGVSVAFAFGCEVLKAADLQVFLNDERLTSGFVVAGVGAPTGGMVTFDVPPANLAQVRIERDIALERLTDYQQNGDFLAKVVNPDFNRLWMALQQHQTLIGRALATPKSDPTKLAPLPSVALRANKLLSFDNDGNPIAVLPSAQSAAALQLLLASPLGAALVRMATGETVEQRLASAVTVATLAAGSADSFAAGVPIAGVAARFQATEAITGHARYAFLDNSTITYNTAGFQAHASFNSNVKIEGTQNSDHHHDYQSYTHHNAGGTLSRFSSFWSQLEHTGVGTIVEASLFKANNPLGTGPIANLYGLYIGPLTRGTANYAIYAPGPTVSYFGGALVLGQIGAPAYVMYNPNSGNLDLIPRTGYGVSVDGPLLFGASTGAPAKISYNPNGNLDITPRDGFNTSVTAGALLVGAATSPAAGEKVNATGSVPDFIARMYNSHVTSPKGLALVYSGAAPNGTGNEFLYCQDSVAIRMKVLSNGNLQNVNNVYGALSDAKLKENITDATPKLDALMLVRIVNYCLKGVPGEKHLGVIAQELEQVFPGMIEETPDFEDVEVEPARIKTTTTQRQKTVAREEVHYEPRLIDGQWRNVQVPVTVDAPLFEDHPLFDEDGAPLMELAEPGNPEAWDEAGNHTPAKEPVYRQRIYQVPVMEGVTNTVFLPARSERRPTGTTTKSVKYSVFVPMLIKALQEQQEQIEALKAVVQP